jgi:integrase
MRATLTDKLLRGIMARGQPHPPISDQVLRGLEVRFSQHGVPTFNAKARQRNGPQQPIRVALGKFPGVSLAEGRERAWPVLRDLKTGIDPRHRAAEVARAEATEQANTYGAVAEEFLKRHAVRARTARAIELRVRRELIARWSDRPIGDIGRVDVIRMLDEIVDRGHPEAARQTLVYGRRLHDWAISRGIYGVESSPYDRLKARDLLGAKKARQRVLNDTELVLIWRATADWPVYGNYVRLLLLLGVRRNELARATWNEIDLNKALWTIPPERMKSDEGLTVPLSPIVVEILSSLPRFGSSPHVFTTRGLYPITDFATIKKQLDRRVVALNGGEPVEHWTLHDCRRTFRTALSTIGISPHICELAIGHRQPQLLRTYDRHRFDTEKRHAFEAHAARLLRIVEPPPPNVVAMKKREK